MNVLRFLGLVALAWLPVMVWQFAGGEALVVRYLLAGASLALLLGAWLGFLDDGEPPEIDPKAAVLLSFLGGVLWPLTGLAIAGAIGWAVGKFGWAAGEWWSPTTRSEQAPARGGVLGPDERPVS